MARKAAGAQSLLVELLTEELPPKSLAYWHVFSDFLLGELLDANLTELNATSKPFVTPRRIAALISNVRSRQPDSHESIKGPAVSAFFDAAGNPLEKVAQGFARRCGVSVQALLKGIVRTQGPKGEYVQYVFEKQGQTLEALLEGIVNRVIGRLHAPKVMRWGDADVRFIRPVRKVVMLHGSHVVKGRIFGLPSGRTTLGHRFMSTGDLMIPEASQYEELLERKGRVVANFERRHLLVRKLLSEAASGTTIAASNSLYAEAAALVEYPAAYTGHFDNEFLEVPQECLTLTMQQNQRYFPLVDSRNRLLNSFLIVSNLSTSRPKNIVRGNERVLRARLADAKFFYHQDRRQKLDARVPRLSSVLYHSKLGSQLQRSERIERLAVAFARILNIAADNTIRAARLAKADLLTDMVGEFPELQGTMGQYYARHDGENAEVCQAIKEHYQPRFAGDALPETIAGTLVALADKLDALTGLFGVGQRPTGDKDPFALRRSALGLLRILIEKNVQLDLMVLFRHSVNEFHGLSHFSDPTADLLAFLLERLRSYLREKGYTPQEIEAVLVLQPTRIDQVMPRINAVRAFAALPEANSLATANKRIANILKKAGAGANTVDRNLLREPAEAALGQVMDRITPDVQKHFAENDYASSLRLLAQVREPVDEFFDKELVMTEDVGLRANRIALLRNLHRLMNQVADISVLAA